jgi:hypothetical protein
MAAGLPDDVVAFVVDHLSSVAQLEILLLLVAREGTDVTPEVAARELRMDQGWAAAELSALVERGLLENGDGTGPAYRFAPKGPEAAALLRRVVDAYAERRAAVITLIYEQPSKTVRTFADAFRLRRG